MTTKNPSSGTAADNSSSPRRRSRLAPLRFDARSVALFASLTFTSALAPAYGQLAAPGASRNGLSPGSSAPALSSSAPATSYAGTQDASAVFRRTDANDDGRLSRAEAERLPAVAEQFDRIDANRDGSISLDELKTALR